MADLQMANTLAAIQQMEGALKALERHWADTQALWNDPVSRHFEKTFQAPLVSQGAVVIKQMRELAQTLDAARHAIPPVRHIR